MAKSMKANSKIKGGDYTERDEKYDKKELKKERKGMKTAGIATELKESRKDMGTTKKPKVKAQKKNMKPVS